MENFYCDQHNNTNTMPTPSKKKKNHASPAETPAPSKTDHPQPSFGEEGGEVKTPSGKKQKRSVHCSFVDHTYSDYSCFELDEVEGKQGGRSRGGQGKRGKLTFPEKLYDIVSNPKYHHIIRWQPHGRCWRIMDKHLLTTVVIPQAFAHDKFESFNRQVNGWGFKRLMGKGPDHRCYYHECFLRGRPEIASLMKRLVAPGKRLQDIKSEPNFYEIDKEFPLPPGPPPVHENITVATSLVSPTAGTPGEEPIMHADRYPPSHGVAYEPSRPSPHPPMLPQWGQPPHQMYWPNQVAPPFQPHPAAPYGFYPYPHMMMAPHPGMIAGPQGYHAGQAYHQPGLHNYPVPASPDETAEPVASDEEKRFNGLNRTPVPTARVTADSSSHTMIMPQPGMHYGPPGYYADPAHRQPVLHNGYYAPLPVPPSQNAAAGLAGMPGVASEEEKRMDKLERILLPTIRGTAVASPHVMMAPQPRMHLGPQGYYAGPVCHQPGMHDGHFPSMTANAASVQIRASHIPSSPNTETRPAATTSVVSDSDKCANESNGMNVPQANVDTYAVDTSQQPNSTVPIKQE